ncbi:hypothetical protein HK101_009348 [Irineochytrium annulatum]|nr:hypothetical protein HK101_009348 [Irineochytrium annulatum]
MTVALHLMPKAANGSIEDDEGLDRRAPAEFGLPDDRRLPGPVPSSCDRRRGPDPSVGLVPVLGVPIPAAATAPMAFMAQEKKPDDMAGSSSSPSATPPPVSPRLVTPLLRLRPPLVDLTAGLGPSPYGVQKWIKRKPHATPAARYASDLTVVTRMDEVVEDADEEDRAAFGDGEWAMMEAAAWAESRRPTTAAWAAALATADARAGVDAAGSAEDGETPRREEVDERDEALQRFLAAMTDVLEHRLRQPASIAFSLFNMSRGSWDFVNETLSKNRSADVQSLLANVTGSVPAKAGNVALLQQFFKFTLMQGSLAKWMEVLIRDKAALGTYYEPHAFLRNTEDASALLLCLTNTVSTREFHLFLKQSSQNAAAAAATAIQGSATAAATAASNFATGALGLGFQTVAAARGNLEILHKAAVSSLPAHVEVQGFKIPIAPTAGVGSGNSPGVVAGVVKKEAGGEAPSKIAQKEGEMEATAGEATKAEGGEDGAAESPSELEVIKKQLEEEKKMRLALQVEMVSVNHRRDIEVSTLKGKLLKAEKALADMKLAHEKLNQELQILRLTEAQL